MVMTFSPPVTPEPKRREGTRVPSSLKPVTPWAWRASPPTALMAMATFWTFSSRYWAVTTTSLIVASRSCAVAGAALAERQTAATPVNSFSVRWLIILKSSRCSTSGDRKATGPCALQDLP